MATTYIDKKAQWLDTIKRNKTLTGQNVRVVGKKEHYGLTGLVLFENRNGILFGPDNDSTEAIFMPWSSIQEISIYPENNFDN